MSNQNIIDGVRHDDGEFRRKIEKGIVIVVERYGDDHRSTLNRVYVALEDFEPSEYKKVDKTKDVTNDLALAKQGIHTVIFYKWDIEKLKRHGKIKLTAFLFIGE